MDKRGQTVLILLLVMSVALAIGLSIVQKSLVDVSTASKVEQSSRAFSAAEAGIEKTLASSAPSPTTLPNNSQITQITDSGLIPTVVPAPNRQDPLEVGPISSPLTKDDVAQVWLVDPNASLPTCSAPSTCYSQTTLDVYWGNSQDDKAALLLTLIYWDGTSYQSRKWYLDNQAATRSPANGFDAAVCSGNYSLAGYQCKKTLGDDTTTSTSSPNGPLPISPSVLILLRARLLYNVSAQPFAVQAVGTGGTGYNLPPQARILTSTGLSGETKRRVQLFQLKQVVPPFFDYAIFSAGDISK